MKNSWNKLLTLAWIVSGSSVPKSQFFSNVNCWLKTEFKHSARMQKYPLGNLGNALLSATDLIYNTWSLVWMQNNFSSNLRVHFKLKFNPNPSSSKPSPTPPPLRAFFPNSKSCQAFSEFISKSILEWEANGSLTVLGKVGEVSPPHLVMPITMEPSKPRMCHDERFLNPVRIKDLPFSL